MYKAIELQTKRLSRLLNEASYIDISQTSCWSAIDAQYDVIRFQSGCFSLASGSHLKHSIVIINYEFAANGANNQ